MKAESAAKAGLGGAGTRHRHDDAVLAAGGVEAVHRLGEEHAVQDVKALDVAGADTEHHEILTLGAGVDDLGGNAVLTELCPCAAVHGVAYFLGTCGG